MANEKPSSLPKWHLNSLKPNTPLPPIICERDKKVLEEVRLYIATEITKLGCHENDPKTYEQHYFHIYSTAFSLLIQHVSAYKDILSDIKREYEDCIMVLVNGRREAKFLESKIRELSSLPTTISCYKRRLDQLNERLEKLRADNQRLENILQELLKTKQEENNSEESSLDAEVEPEHMERRPIPGLAVSDWTNEKVLEQAIRRLDSTIYELKKQKTSSYVLKSEKDEVYEDFQLKMREKEKMEEKYNKLKKRHRILKVANEAMQEYKELMLHKSGIKLEDYVKNKITEFSLHKKSSLMRDTPQTGYEDDDPTKEKEAEMILEYIDKFNDLFHERDYTSAAIHAANSPRGVLRAIETLLRFKDASENFTGTPTPLLLFAEAFMYSSSAQSHIADEEISYECVSCALHENRPEMVIHWMSQGYLTSCKKVADLLSQYAETNPQYRVPCLVAAQKMYSESSSCNILAASHLFKLKQVNGMLDYANAKKFTIESYFDLIKKCLDEDLVWILSRTFPEENKETNDSRFSGYHPPLPIPISQSLVVLIGEGDKGKQVAVNLLDQIFKGKRIETDQEFEKEGPLDTSDLSKIIYREGEDAYDTDVMVRRRWKMLAKECEEQDKIDLAIEIRAAIVVKNAIICAISVIAEDEKEQFDYYT